MREKRTRAIRRRAAAGLPMVATAFLGLLPATGASAGSMQQVNEPVSFTVTNANASQVPCAAGGASYTVSGHLVAPVEAGGSLPATVTLYLHGLGFGEFFWDFTAVPGYDYAGGMASLGHASLVIDRVGYGASGHPPGTLSCVGAQATVAHQIVQDLRTGAYRLSGSPTGVAFSRVVLAGHSAGGAIAEVEASSFRDVDGLIVMAYADAGGTQRASHEFAAAGQDCAQGGQPAGPGQPGGYAPFGQTPADFQADMFFSADPRVVQSVTLARHLDPCGDDNSIPQTIAHNLAGLGDVTVPVLLVYGANDALFQPPGTTEQHLLFTGSTDVTTQVLDGTGHALAFERSRLQLRRLVAGWLRTRAL